MWTCALYWTKYNSKHTKVMFQDTITTIQPCNHITQHILFMAIQMIVKYINYCYFDVLCDHSFKVSWVNCQFHHVTTAIDLQFPSVYRIY
jgi:hypothetical protein